MNTILHLEKQNLRFPPNRKGDHHFAELILETLPVRAAGDLLITHGSAASSSAPGTISNTLKSLHTLWHTRVLRRVHALYLMEYSVTRTVAEVSDF